MLGMFTPSPGGTGVHVLVDLISDWEYLDRGPFLAPLELSLGPFQKLWLRVALPASHGSPSVTPQADTSEFTTAAISELFPFCSLGLTFSLS